MPMINHDLQVTKNEITLQVFKVKNSERAGKVLAGASTDMKDMLNLCNHYGIDICQFMRLPDGTHPVMMHRDEIEALQRAATGADADLDTADEAAEPADDAAAETKAVPEIASAEMRYLNDANVGQIIEQLKQQDEKIAALYERIVQLTAENGRLRERLKTGYAGMVADESCV